MRWELATFPGSPGGRYALTRGGDLQTVMTQAVLASENAEGVTVNTGRLSFRVPGKGTEIKLEPARAHTVTTQGDETLLLAFLGPQKSVKLTWRYQPEEKEQEPPLVFSTDTMFRGNEYTVLGASGMDPIFVVVRVVPVKG